MGLYKMRTEFGHQMKWLLIIIAGGFLIGGLYVFTGFGGGSSMQRSGASPSDVIATVGGMNVTRGEFEAAWERELNVLTDQQAVHSTLQQAQRRAQLFQSLIEDRVILAIAKDLGVEVPDSEVKSKIDELVAMGLRDARRSAMGKMSASQEKIDPRYDREYADVLRQAGSSVRQVEDNIRERISEDGIRSQLARERIQTKIRQRVGTISASDVADSYKVYTVRQIVIPKGAMPADQLRAQVEKIVSKARAGGNFAALAKEYSQDKGKAGTNTVSFDRVLGAWMMTLRGGAQYAPMVKSSLDIWNQVSKLKAGEVATPMDTDQAVYILKVESVTSKMPAKSDKKAQDQRRAEIEAIRVWAETLNVEQQVRKRLPIDVKDPECRGYWELAQLGQAISDPAQVKAALGRAKAAFEKAITQNPNNPYAATMLAMVLVQSGDSKQAVAQLAHLLESPDSRADGADLRIIFGDLLLQSSKELQAAKKPDKAAETKEAAVKQYIKASEFARFEPGPHVQLIEKFKQVGRPDLVAKERQWMADFETKRKALEAERAKSGGVPTPAPTPAPGPAPAGP